MEAFSVWFLSTFGWIEQSLIGQFVRTTPYLYPTLMSLHVLGIALMVGPAFALDCRLLGFGKRQVAVSTAAKLLMPLSHAGFVIVALTGAAMFTGIVYVLSQSAAAPWKFGLIFLAGLNILIFHKGVYRTVAQWDIDLSPPLSARFAAVISILCWTGVIFGGRFLSY